MPLKEVSKNYGRQFVGQSRGVAQASIPQNDQRSQLLSSLSKFASVANVEVDRQQKAEIETQKVLGASRAAQDLLKADNNRRGNTDQDTKASKLVYNSIVGKNDVMNAGNEYAAWYQENPTADEQMIEDKKRELYSPLLEKYSDDEQSLKQISLDVQNSQFSLLPIEDRIKKDYESSKNQEALGISIDNLLSTPDADMETILDKELPARAKALGLSESQLKKTLLEQASVRGKAGDGRLIQALEVKDWAKNTASLSASRDAYDRVASEELVEETGNARGDIKTQMLSLEVPWETTNARMKQHNRLYPQDKYSSKDFAAMKVLRSNTLAARDKKTAIIKEATRRQNSDSGIPLAQDNSIDKKMRTDLVNYYDDLFANSTQEMIDSGVDEQAARRETLKRQLKWSVTEQTPLPTLQRIVDATLNLPFDDKTGELPEYVKSNFDMINKMDGNALNIYAASDKDKAFFMNFKSLARSTSSDTEAYKQAMAIRNSPYKFTPETRNRQLKSVNTVIKNELESGYWILGTDIEVPEWSKIQVLSEVSRGADNLFFQGSSDPDHNAKQSMLAYRSRTHQISSGAVVNQPQAVIYNQISDGRPMRIENTNAYLDSFVEQSLPIIAENTGFDLDAKDISYKFSRDGSAFVLTRRGVEEVSENFPTKYLYSIGRNAIEAASSDSNVSDKVQKERVKAEEDLQEGEDAYQQIIKNRSK